MRRAYSPSWSIPISAVKYFADGFGIHTAQTLDTGVIIKFSVKSTPMVSAESRSRLNFAFSEWSGYDG